MSEFDALMRQAERNVYRRVMGELRAVLPVALREAGKKRKAETDLVRYVSGTVREIDGSDAVVHIDGDGQDDTVAAKMIGVKVVPGARVMVAFAPRHAAYVHGPLGGATITSGGDGGGLTVGEHNALPHDLLVHHGTLPYAFFYVGNATVSTSPFRHFIHEDEVPVQFVACAGTHPTVSDLILDLRLDNVSILTAPLHIPAGSADGQQFYADSFTINPLTRRSAAEPAALTAHITAEDSGNNAADVTATLAYRKATVSNPIIEG